MAIPVKSFIQVRRKISQRSLSLQRRNPALEEMGQNSPAHLFPGKKRDHLFRSPGEGANSERLPLAS